MRSITRANNSIRAFVDSLVHDDVRQDMVQATRHRAFLTSRLLRAMAFAAVLPIYLALCGIGHPKEIVPLAIGLLAIGNVIFVSRTGKLEVGHVIATLNTALVIVAAAVALPISVVFLAAWLIVPVFEATAFSSQRSAYLSAAIAVATIAFLGAAEYAGLVGAAVQATPTGLMPLIMLINGAAVITALSTALQVTHINRIGEIARMRNEARYYLLAGHMTDLITRHGRTGQVSFASPAAEKLLGIASEDLLGYGLFDLVHVADRPAYLKALAEAAQVDGESALEFRLQRRDDQGMPYYIWAEMRCARVRTPEGDGGGRVVAVTRDVTERKEQELMVDAARSEADRANAARGRFLANVSHELRTPLNAIIGFSEMLTQEEALRITAEKRREYAHLIHESGEHLLKLVNSLLDVSKIESGHFEIVPEPFAVGALMGNVHQLLALRAEQSGIAFQLEVEANLPELSADKRACRQIMLNLLSNALKFTPAGGSVTSRAYRVGSMMALEVIDTGVGINADDLDQLGRPFFQARGNYDRPFEGTGLGLSVVKGLLELHNGRLEIASVPGKGTTMRAMLPITDAATTPFVRPNAPSTASDSVSAYLKSA